MPDRRTRTGVEIARVGTFDLSTGPFEFTRQHLANAVKHAATQAPRIGIGHTDPRFDGDPAFGLVKNLRLDEDGDLLVGDLDGLAGWLDDSLDVAYPGRSLEARVAGDDMRITAVKLLGTTPPGISTLKDLASAIAASVADGETSEEAARIAVRTLVASDPAGITEPAIPATTHHEEESTVDPKNLREQLGLAEDASDDDVTTKLSELLALPSKDDVVSKTDHQAAIEQAKTEAVDAERQAVAAAAGDDDNVKLDRATYDDLKAAADDGRQARKKQVADERDAFIAAAVSDGKFPPARVEHYTKRYDSDPDGTKAEIDAPEKGVIPVTEIGASTSTESTELESTGLFPQLTTTEA